MSSTQSSGELATEGSGAENAEMKLEVDRGVDVGEILHDTGGVFHHAGTEGRARPAPPPTAPATR